MKKTDKIFRSPKFSLIENRSRHGTTYGWQHQDGTIHIISNDKDEALDFIYQLQRGHERPHYAFTTKSKAKDYESDAITSDQIVTNEDDIIDADSLEAATDPDFAEEAVAV